MKFEIFSIYDSKAESYSKPIFFESKGVAIRSFMDSLKDQQNTVARHPEDFTLFHLATWDDKNAQFNNNQTPISAGTALELMPKDFLPKQLNPVKTDNDSLEVKGA